MGRRGDPPRPSVDRILAAHAPPAAADPDKIADWLGEMRESRNVFDHTDEATTVINIDVGTLAQRFAVEINNSVAAALAADREPSAGVLRERVAALHYRCGPDGVGGAEGYCHECVLPWPCPTAVLLAEDAASDG